MSDQKTKKRPYPTSVRLRDEPLARRQAKARGMKLGEYINHKVYDKRSRLPIKQQDTAATLTALQHLTDELKRTNDIAEGDIEHADQLLELLECIHKRIDNNVAALLKDAGWSP